MATYEEAISAFAMTERTDAEVEQLIRLLEADPYWRLRYQLPEPVRMQLIQMQDAIINSRSAMNMSALARERFKESSEWVETVLDMGMLPTTGMEEAWRLAVEGGKLSIGASGQMCDALRETINAFRSMRGEKLLTGAESISN